MPKKKKSILDMVADKYNAAEKAGYLGTWAKSNATLKRDKPPKKKPKK